MSDGKKKYNYVIEFDFADLNVVEHINDVNDLQHELFEDVGVVLSRIFDKYDSLVGFKQSFEEVSE